MAGMSAWEAVLAYSMEVRNKYQDGSVADGEPRRQIKPTNAALVSLLDEPAINQLEDRARRGALKAFHLGNKSSYNVRALRAILTHVSGSMGTECTKCAKGNGLWKGCVVLRDRIRGVQGTHCANCIYVGKQGDCKWSAPAPVVVPQQLPAATLQQSHDSLVPTTATAPPPTKKRKVGSDDSSYLPPVRSDGIPIRSVVKVFQSDINLVRSDIKPTLLRADPRPRNQNRRPTATFEDSDLDEMEQEPSGGISGSKQRTEDIQEKVNELSHENLMLKAELAARDQQDSEGFPNAREEMIERQQKEIFRLRQEVSAFKDRHQRALEKAGAENAERRLVEEREEQARIENTKLQQAVHASQEDHSKKDKKIRELRAQFEDTKRAGAHIAEALGKTLEELRQNGEVALQALQGKYEEQGEELEKLQQTVQTSQTSLVEAQNEARDVRNELASALVTRRDEHEQEVSQLRSQLRQSCEDMQQVRGDRDEADQKLDALQKEIEGLGQKLNEKETEAKDATAKVKDLRRKLDVANLKVKTLQEDIDEERASAARRWGEIAEIFEGD